MFPFEKTKPFLVTNEDLKLASLFGRKNRSLFGRKMQKISEISRKKCKENAKNCLILCHHDSFPKNYKLVIRPLIVKLYLKIPINFFLLLFLTKNLIFKIKTDKIEFVQFVGFLKRK